MPARRPRTWSWPRSRPDWMPSTARDGAGPGPTRAPRSCCGRSRKGTSAFGGAKAKREIAGRPAAPYGRLRATRPGEYLLLDTTRLDVFAMDPVTLRWVQAELTVAMDLYDRCITGLRLTPVSTKAVDAAAVLFESVRPLPEPAAGWADVRPPYHGLPGRGRHRRRPSSPARTASRCCRRSRRRPSSWTTARSTCRST